MEEKHCLNCGNVFDVSSKFCESCGQSTKKQSLNIKDLVLDFFSNVFNLNNKIWKTLRDIWGIAILPKAYIEGKRIKYQNPFRLFLVVLFGFFAILIGTFSNTLDMSEVVARDGQRRVERDRLLFVYDSLSDLDGACRQEFVQMRNALFSIMPATIDSVDVSDLSPISYGSLLQIYSNDPSLTIVELQGKADSLCSVQAVNEQALGKMNFGDSIIAAYKDAYSKNIYLGDFQSSVNGLEATDFYRLSTDSLQNKLAGKSKVLRLFIAQMQKVLLNPSASIKYIIGNGTWVLVTVILMMALLFKVLYYRHSMVFVKHFIFHLYGHIRILILLIISLLLNKVVPLNNWYWLGIGLIGVVYMALELSAYYKESKMRTFWKLVITLIGYVLSLVLFSLIGSAISLLIL
jgi:hypothetical protein